MYMNSLKAIHTIAKVARILSKIIYICCIVGACACVVGIISLSLGAGALKFGGVTFESLIKNNSGYSKSTMYLVMTVGIIFSVGEGVLSKFANVYFKNELKAGTPFTLSGANELLRLGILSIAIPVFTYMLSNIIYDSFKAAFIDVQKIDGLNGGVSLSLGICLIIISLICRYGAEVTGDKKSGS